MGGINSGLRSRSGQMHRVTIRPRPSLRKMGRLRQNPALRSAAQALRCPPRTRPRASDRYDAGPTAWTHSGHFDAAPEQIAPMHTGSSQLASRLPSYALATRASVRRRTPSCNSRAQDHTTRGRTRWPCPLPFTSKGRQPCPLPFRVKGRQPSRWGAVLRLFWTIFTPAPPSARNAELPARQTCKGHTEAGQGEHARRRGTEAGEANTSAIGSEV